MTEKRMAKHVKAGYLLFGALLIKGLVFPDLLIPQGNVTIGNQILFGFFGLLLVWGSSMMWDAWKYSSPKVIASDIDASISTAPDQSKRFRDWLILRLGGITTKMWNYPGSEGTLISHITAHEWMGSSILVKGKAKRVDPRRLDTKTRRFLQSNGYPSPYYIIEAPAEVEERNQAFVEWSERNGEENAVSNTKDQLHAEIRDLAEDVDQWENRLNGGSYRKSAKEKLDSIRDKLEDGDGGQ